MVWLEKQEIGLITEDSSLHVATYVETLGRHLSAPSTKLSLAAIRKMFDWLTTGGVLPFNPIEQAFATLKALLRKAAARSLPDL